MIQFTKPETLDGALLIKELLAVGVKVKPDLAGICAPFIDGNGNFFLDIASKDEAKAGEIVAAHKGVELLA